MEEGINQDVLSFRRSVRPAFAVKSPSLVGFFDGSSLAVASAVYIRWMCYKNAPGVQDTKLKHGSSQDSDYNPGLHKFKSFLLTSKARVATMDGLTIPRS